ncbi:MAG: TonB-dependent receptor, partial [Pyrinomonadaceae bacterium]
MRKRFFRGVALFTFLLVFTGVSFAQGTTSRITGLITDSSGAPVTGAMVTIKAEGTGSTLKTQTSDGGTYTFDLIQPGKYEVTVEKTGFKKSISTGNAALVNQPSTVNMTLEVGDVSAAVTVVGVAEQVQTSASGNIGSTVDQKTIESLPIVGLRGRNPLDLLNFQPGVVVGSNTGGGVSVNGSRDRSFNFTLDGIDINESTAGGSNFTPLRPNPDSVQEFQIVTSNFTAELGRSSGASVTFVTRSGTNQFHGNLFEYYQTPRFNAKSYPITIAKLPKDQFVQHIFGGSFGGPLFNPGFGEGTKPRLLRDKAFFFVNLQLLRAYDTALVTRTVYTASARTGLYRYVVGRANANAGSSTPSVDATGAPVLPACSGTITTLCIATYNIATQQSVATIDTALQSIINAMPLPNNFSSGDGLNTAGFNFASPQHEKQYDFASKFDFKINNKNSTYVRYAQGSQTSLGDSGNGGRPIFPNTPNIVDTSRTPKNLAVNWRWAPTATVANEFLYGLSKYFFTFGTPSPDPLFAFTFLNPATPNLNFSYNARGVRTNQFIDNLTMVHGSHTFKTGINFRFNQHKDDRSNVAGSAIEPIVTFSGTAGGDTGFNLPPTTGAGLIQTADLTRLRNTIADLLGRIGSVSRAFVADPANPGGFLPAGSRWINKAKYKEYDFYGQDNWRVRPNLVLDLGVRWEVRATPEQIGRPLLVPNQSVKLGAAPSNNLTWVPGKLFKTAYNNIEPSVGFAWDPFKSGKTSIRGNYRLASDRFATFLFGSSIFQSTPGNNSGPSNSTFGQAGGLYRNIGPIIAGLTPNPTRTPAAFGTGSTSVIDPDLRYPQIHEFSLSVQREIGKNVVEVTYIRKHAVHLLGGYNVNEANLFKTVPGVTDGANTFL